MDATNPNTRIPIPGNEYPVYPEDDTNRPPFSPV